MSEAPPRRPESIGKLVQAGLDELSAVFHERLNLVASEARQAASALKQILLYALAGFILALTAWITLVATVVSVLVSVGLSWPWAFLAVTLLCVISAGVLLSRIKALGTDLGFAASRRAWKSLRDLPRNEPPPQPNSELAK